MINSNRLISAAILLFLWLFGSISFGNDQDILIDKALRLSGTIGQIEQLSKSILSAVPADAFPDQKARNDAEIFVRKNASKEAMTDVVRSSVREKFDKESIEKVIMFYDSTLGRKVGRLQGNSLETGLLKDIREGRKTVVSLDDDRLKIIKRIIDSARVSQANKMFTTSLVRGMLKGSVESANTLENEAEQLSNKLKAVEKTLAAEQHRMDDMVLTAYSLTFRSLNDKELEELAAYHESPAALWFRDTIQSGLDQAIFNTARALGEALTASRNTVESEQNSASSNRRGKRKDRDE